MRKKLLITGLLLVFLGFQAAAQDADGKIVTISGDLTTIYTLGNADTAQRIGSPDATGGYFSNVDENRRSNKNGFYTAANLYALLRPVDGLEGYLKLYAIHRPGSFYLPLSMENQGREDFASLKLDAVYGRASIFKLLNMGVPVDLYLKAGKYKAQAAQYGIVSKYKTEQVLYMMNTKTDFTYEVGAGLEAPIPVNFFAAINYLFNESVQRHYDEDGAERHGKPVLNEYAPQFLIGAQLKDYNNISAELLYGQNVSNIYSGHAAGLSARYTLNVMDGLSIPIGLSFAFHEKNIDILGQSAVSAMSGANIDAITMEFRESLGVALGAGARYEAGLFDIEFNLAGAFYSIRHIYRTNLNVMNLSTDFMVTYQKNFFLGAGLIFGTLGNAEWKTRPDSAGREDYFHIFKTAENMGYEVYAGLNLAGGKFVIGFNQNKGISLNNMLEARHEGQMKYKQKNTAWEDRLVEAGGLYFKFFYRF